MGQSSDILYRIYTGKLHWKLVIKIDIQLGEKIFYKNGFQVGDGPEKSMETREGWKHARRLPYFRTMAEKDDNEFPCHPFPPLFGSRVVFLRVFIPPLFPYFFQVHPYLKSIFVENFFP